MVDLQTFQKIMRYNDYKNDPYSEGQADEAICARGDLLDSPVAGGCLDCKVNARMPACRLVSVLF